MYKKILIGVDGSEDAHKALNKVIDLYKNWGSEIIVFHSIQHHMILSTFPIFGMNYSTPARSYTSIFEDYKKAGLLILEETKKIFDKAGVPVETRLIEDIKPEQYIVDKTVEEKFDLVILGHKGHHSKIHNLLGSISSYVLNNVSCDVLITR